MFIVLSDPAIYEFENQAPVSVEWLRNRFAKLESRLSPDGQQRWLNWVIRLPKGELIGYVQATIFPDDRADLAVVLASAYWGQGLAKCAVKTMMDELITAFQVQHFTVVLKERNFRSRRLWESLGFRPASNDVRKIETEADELLMEQN
jgi:RimJ/RimL family protein N-acetyltransferase